MPRIRYIEEIEKTPQIDAMITSAERTGAPDPRVVRIMTRSAVGSAWVELWNKVLYEGVLPHKLKEMCRIKISVAHQCGYCSTVRSKVAQKEGLTEDMINDLPPRVRVTKFSPPRLEIKFEDIVSREIKVQVSRTGEPAKGYAVSGLIVEPEMVATG